ncbi:AraC family transcriptional regulator [Gammaproteobacteria bacterium AS21]
MLNDQLCLKSYQPFSDSHSHDFHQLVLPIHGALDIEIGSQSGFVGTNSAAVIHANQKHAFESHGKNQFIVADISVNLAPSFAALPTFMQLNEHINRYLHFLYAQLALNVNQQTQRQMLMLLVQLLDNQHSAATDTQHSTIINKRLLRARDYLQNNLARPKALTEAAHVANISERHLRTLFNQYYQLSPSQFLRQLRMQNAWQLLQTSRLSIAMIAEQSGYTNLSAFSDSFQKYFNNTPGQIRRLNK